LETPSKLASFSTGSVAYDPGMRQMLVGGTVAGSPDTEMMYLFAKIGSLGFSSSPKYMTFEHKVENHKPR
jgi:hypothetical protein